MPKATCCNTPCQGTYWRRNDPTRADRLVGQVLVAARKLPGVYGVLEINFFLLRRLNSMRTEVEAKKSKAQKMERQETLMMNIGSIPTGGRVFLVKRDIGKFALLSPVCTSIGENVALSGRADVDWRLISCGKIRAGDLVDPVQAEYGMLCQLLV